MTMSDGRKEFFHSMFVTAMEGGIDYWAFRREYSWSKGGAGAIHIAKAAEEDLDGFYAYILPSEEEWGVEEVFCDTGDLKRTLSDEQQRQSLYVGRAVIERGWNLFMDKVIAAAKSEDDGADCSRKYFRQAVIQYLTDGEDGDSDADVADIVVQLGLFGEIVYA